MTLREWMDKKGFTQTQAAAVLGVPQGDVSGYLRGRMPTVERALQFEERTDGDVRPVDWVKSRTQSLTEGA